MNKQTIFSMCLLGLAVVGFTWGGVAQNKANANEEYFSLLKEKEELLQEKQENSEGWRVDQYAMDECVQSFTDQQNKRHDRNVEIDERVAQIDDRLGFIRQSQLQ